MIPDSQESKHNMRIVCKRERGKKQRYVSYVLRYVMMSLRANKITGVRGWGRIKKKRKGKVNIQANIVIGIIQITASPH